MVRRASGASPLAGRVVVVTGAARGLGAGMARSFSARGARVALLGLEPAHLAEVAAECGSRAAWWQVDVTDEQALKAVAAEVEASMGPADVVVANAGIAAGGPVAFADPAAFDRVIEVNLLGSARTVRAFLPQVLRRRGYVLQIASLAAILPAPTMAAYCASKSGVEAFAHALAIEVASHRVDVGVAYLSWIDTDMVRGADAVPGLGTQRAGLPFPLNRTYPAQDAVEALVRAVERRSRHVCYPRWVGAARMLRGPLPPLLALIGAGRAAAIEQSVASAGGSARTMPVGAGGQADTAIRTGSR